MSLSLGELVGYIRGDDSQFVRTLDDADRHMGHFQTSTNGRLRLMEGQFGERGAAMGRALGRGIDETLASLHPEIEVDADSRPADEHVAALYRRLEALRDVEIGVDIPTDQALREMDEIHAALTVLTNESPDIRVQATTEGALFALNQLRIHIDEVDAAHPTVDVDVDGARAEGELRRVDDAARRVGNNDGAQRQASKMGGLTSAVTGTYGALTSMPAMIAAGIPVAAGLAAALVQIAPAAAIGATGVLALAQATAAIKIGTSGVGAALSAAFAPGTSGASSAANSARQYADAQRALKDAISQAAYANQQAVQQVASAERSLTTAQLAAKQAQLDLTQARKDATRQLQDQNNSLKDAQLAQRQAVLDVSAAEKNLAAVKAQGTAATKDQIDAAQLQYEEAVQSLTEQNLAVDRLSTDTAAANKAGVEGSKTVTDAKKQVSSANQTVSDQERALADARTQQARTAAQGLESIQKAQEALTAAATKSAGGVNALAAAMAKLSPQAQAFVRQVIALKPAWDALKISVQDALFQGLAGTLKSTAGSVLPVLRKELTNSASALNDMAKGAMASAKNLADSGVLGQAMHSASTGLHNLSGIPGIVVTAFGQLAAAAGPSFEKMTKAIGGVASEIGKSLGNAFKSGAMQSAIETAVGLIKEIGKIAGNVFSIIGSVMKATAQSGGGFLGALVTISDTLKKTFASPDVQAGLRAIFSTMEVLAKTVAPLLNEAIKGIAPVLTALGPPVKALIEALGKALGPIIKALSPVLTELATAVGDIVIACLPFLGVVSDLIVIALKPLTPILKMLGEVFVMLAPIVAQVAKAIGGALGPVLLTLGDTLIVLVRNGAKQFMNIILLLLPIIPQLIPVLMQLADSVSQILLALIPLMPQLTQMAIVMAQQLIPALIPLIPPLTQLTIMLLRFATDVIVAIVIPAMTKMIDFLAGFQKKMQPAYDAVKWLTDHIASMFQWLSDHLVGHSVIPDMINAIVRWFAGLPGRAWDALSSLGSRISGQASAAGTAMVNAIRSKLTSAVSWVSGLPGRVGNALGDLSGYLYDSGRSLISGFINGLKSMGADAGNAALDLLSNVRNYFPFSPARKGPFSGKGWTSYSGAAIAAAMAGGMTSGQGSVLSAAQQLAATAQRGLTGAGTPMGNLVTSPSSGGRTGAGGGGGGSTGGSSGGGTQRVVITLAGPEEVKKFLRHIVTTDAGGNVQKAFGY